MKRLWPSLIGAVAIATTAGLTASGALPRPTAPVSTAGSAAAAQVQEEPEPTPMPPSEFFDQYLTGGQGPPAYDRPSHSFDDEAWEACTSAPGPYPSEWDGCDPLGGDGDYYHYDKPYGRSPGDALAFLLWEPGRFERAGRTFFAGRGYYQSDRWRGPVSWDDAGYADPESQCGGYYAENVHLWSGPSREVPLPLPFTIATPEITVPVPSTDEGWGVQGCTPR